MTHSLRSLLAWHGLTLFCLAAQPTIPCPHYKALDADQRLAVVDATVPLDIPAVTLGNPKQVRLQFDLPGLNFNGNILPPVGRFWGQLWEHAQMPEVRKRIEEMAERGYVAGDMWGDKGTTTLYFKHRPELFSSEERPPEPEWVAAQRAQLVKAFPNPGPGIGAVSYGAAGTPNGTFLTGRSLTQVEPGSYTWVRLKGENFIRIGKRGHLWLGGEEDALGGGEIVIEKVGETNQVVSLNNKTATYSAAPDYLRNGVEALWRQGIFPSRLEISAWNDTQKAIVPVVTLQKDGK